MVVTDRVSFRSLPYPLDRIFGRLTEIHEAARSGRQPCGLAVPYLRTHLKDLGDRAGLTEAQRVMVDVAEAIVARASDPATAGQLLPQELLTVEFALAMIDTEGDDLALQRS